MATTIGPAVTDEEVLACWPVMSALRPHVPREDFLARVRRQQQGGFVLTRVVQDGAVRAVAGFVVAEKLAWGRHLYVDDLVTDPDHRSAGHGAALLAWLADHARAEGCDSLHLDSGVQRHAAHRFYLTQRMDITSYHFAKSLG